MNHQETAFMGRITASVTHEFRNVLAIIKESAGLMDDLMQFGKGDPTQYKEKFNRHIGKILAQVDRGTLLAGGLNKFAHAPDSRRAEINMGDLLEHLVTLGRRVAHMKLVTLEVRQVTPPAVVINDPLALLMTIFTAVEGLLHLAPALKTITFHAVPEDECVYLDLTMEGSEDELGGWPTRLKESAAWGDLGQMAVRVGAEVELDEEFRRLRLKLLRGKKG